MNQTAKNDRAPFPTLALLAVVLGSLVPEPARAAESLGRLADVHRVVFLGDSITYSGQYIEFVETFFAIRFPARRIEFLNLGLPSETVSGLSEAGHASGQFPRPELRERLTRVLEKTRPDLVIACYGMNDGIYLPFSRERFAKFKEGMLELHAQTLAFGAKIIHATPPAFDELKGGHAGYSHTLDLYSDWLLSQRAAGWDVVDFHGPMNRFLASARQKDPTFFLAHDGVHCNEIGHWLMAKQLLSHLGAGEQANLDDPQALLEAHPHGKEILKLVQEKQRMTKDAWLTWTGHKRPLMKVGLPLTEAEAKARELDKKILRLNATGPLPVDTNAVPSNAPAGGPNTHSSN